MYIDKELHPPRLNRIAGSCQWFVKAQSVDTGEERLSEPQIATQCLGRCKGIGISGRCHCLPSNGLPRQELGDPIKDFEASAGHR